MLYETKAQTKKADSEVSQKTTTGTVLLCSPHCWHSVDVSRHDTVPVERCMTNVKGQLEFLKYNMK